MINPGDMVTSHVVFEKYVPDEDSPSCKGPHTQTDPMITCLVLAVMPVEHSSNPTNRKARRTVTNMLYVQALGGLYYTWEYNTVRVTE